MKNWDDRRVFACLALLMASATAVTAAVLLAALGAMPATSRCEGWST